MTAPINRPLFLSSDSPDSYEQALRIAADLLLDGELVAFPTETVYGLGAVINRDDALSKIFTAKGRPQTNPLIVHVPDFSWVEEWAREIPDIARALAAHFWPGPLTIVLRRSPRVSDVITAGQDSVGLRCPDHPVALDLLRAVGVPLAAPSANRSEHISPTCAQHVVSSLGDHVAAVLDGGCCSQGLESTVVRVTDLVIEILRPGPVTRQQMEALGFTVVESNIASTVSPGQAIRHYAPDTPVRLLDAIPADLESFGNPEQVGLIVKSDDDRFAPYPHRVIMAQDGEGYAQHLYETLHQLDRLKLQVILIERPARTDGIWVAVQDRLRRCASK